MPLQAIAHSKPSAMDKKILGANCSPKGRAVSRKTLPPLSPCCSEKSPVLRVNRYHVVYTLEVYFHQETTWAQLPNQSDRLVKLIPIYLIEASCWSMPSFTLAPSGTDKCVMTVLAEAKIH